MSKQMVLVFTLAILLTGCSCGSSSSLNAPTVEMQALFAPIPFKSASGVYNVAYQLQLSNHLTSGRAGGQVIPGEVLGRQGRPSVIYLMAAVSFQ